MSIALGKWAQPHGRVEIALLALLFEVSERPIVWWEQGFTEKEYELIRTSTLSHFWSIWYCSA